MFMDGQGVLILFPSLPQLFVQLLAAPWLLCFLSFSPQSPIFIVTERLSSVFFSLPSSQLFLLLLAVAVGLSNGAEALQISRVGLSQVPELHDETGLDWQDVLPRYPPLQALSLTHSVPEKHHHYEGYTATHHRDQHEIHSSLATVLPVSHQSTWKNLRACPTEIGVKVGLKYFCHLCIQVSWVSCLSRAVP